MITGGEDTKGYKLSFHVDEVVLTVLRYVCPEENITSADFAAILYLQADPSGLKAHRIPFSGFV
ncbi:hypothetical protein BWI93_12160 [Siphonobacter sp. BAB-5385]|nr:hypothetical protein BWI93_12160 [Siphonobacter sp. BAB-5385]PMD90768.1 hypothetical protein BWI97_22605 [Siphonobacter sp. BAB-5405]